MLLNPDSIKLGHCKRILAVFLLLCLLFQVQTAFACEMMPDHSGSMEDCCCHTMKAVRKLQDLQSDPCCEFSTKLAFKGADLEQPMPIMASAPPQYQLPDLAPYLVLAVVWPEDVQNPLNPQILRNNASNASAPGRKTYLSTLRLRI